LVISSDPPTTTILLGFNNLALIIIGITNRGKVETF